MRLAILFFTASMLASAANWSGFLVDSKCYNAEERNRNPTDTSSVDRDGDYEVRYCHPNPKTKIFALVLPDWSSLRLDSSSGAKAADLVRATGKQRYFAVTVTGDMDPNNKASDVSHAKN